VCIHVITAVDETPSVFQEIERTCALSNIRKATRVITDLYEEALSPSGIPATQFILLIAVKNHEPISMSHLAHGLHMDRTTLTRTLKPLQEKGWVVVSPGKDRRVQEIRLTPRGDETLTGAVPLWQQAQKQVEEQLGGEAWGQLLIHLYASTALKG
jgi:DNA-binding MarR family transcriptional regulator